MRIRLISTNCLATNGLPPFAVKHADNTTIFFADFGRYTRCNGRNSLRAAFSFSELNNVEASKDYDATNREQALFCNFFIYLLKKCVERCAFAESDLQIPSKCEHLNSLTAGTPHFLLSHALLLDDVHTVFHFICFCRNQGSKFGCTSSLICESRGRSLLVFFFFRV